MDSAKACRKARRRKGKESKAVTGEITKLSRAITYKEIAGDRLRE